VCINVNVYVSICVSSFLMHMYVITPDSRVVEHHAKITSRQPQPFSHNLLEPILVPKPSLRNLSESILAPDRNEELGEELEAES